VKLPRSFYRRPAIDVARDLLGRTLVHVDLRTRRAGRIVETEAYVGAHDLACHASKGRTARTDVMFGDGGYAYVYLIYGMYDCFNVVTDRAGHPSAVLVRALCPLEGCLRSTDGPGKLCRALAVTRAQNGLDLRGGELFIESGEPPAPRRIRKGPRIGVEYSGHWAKRHLRFWIDGDPWVSDAPAKLRKLRLG
jgi:DNA-3-methyladenine glycosylase